MSKEIMKRVTRTYLDTDGKTKLESTAKYGFNWIKGNDAPCFGVTVDTYRVARNGRRVEDSFGCQHDVVRRRFPEIAHLVKWHCVSLNQPMHYVANGIFWWELATGVRTLGAGDTYAKSLEHFKGTIVFGAVASDSELDLSSVLTDDDTDEDANTDTDAAKLAKMRQWLADRLPALMATFRLEMTFAGFDLDAVKALMVD